MAEIEIKGLEKFKSQLNKLDFSKRVPVLVKGVLRAVEPTRVQIGMEAPVDTGELSQSIVAQEAKGSDLNSVTIEVGASANARQGFFQEFGTAHHPPQPFFDRTITQNIDEIQENIADFIQQEIDRVLTA